MKRPTVRCGCGHQVLAKEVLRTDLYERPNGREYVYVKYRCKRCKRIGETFVPEHRWDWRIFQASRHELSQQEVEYFADLAPISSEDVIDFHCQLTAIDLLDQLNQRAKNPCVSSQTSTECKTDSTPRTETKRGENDSKKDSRKGPKKTGRPEDGKSL